jgi:ADP-heptose:LPS heptosyltransferase
MNKIYIDLSDCFGLGDTICATPIIKKLFSAYNKKISIITNYIDVFKDNPHIDNILLPNELINLDDDVSIFKTFNLKKDSDIELKHNIIDIRQLHAINLGFTLTNDELELDYYPDEYIQIKNLPEKYVLIHPVQSWESRTWKIENWKLLTSMLNNLGIPIVSVGKTSHEVGFFDIQKPVFDFKINLGLNLLNKTSLSQTWHLINKAQCFITMDSGLLHLAGTTDTHILQLGSSINNKFRAPYRKGTQSYKYNYVSGDCNLFCASDMKYGVKEWGTIMGVPPLIGCLENKDTFECHPDVFQVFNKTFDIISKYE